MCTWWQCVSHAEQRWASGRLDRAARVAAHALHDGRQVSQLRLQLVQQRRVHVEQRVGFGAMQLQGT